MEKNSFYKLAYKICPPVALIFSILVTITTLYINEGLSLLFIFNSIQVYLNWYAVYTISQGVTTETRQTHGDESDSVAISIAQESGSPEKIKYWYCDICQNYTYRPTQHCIVCNKCFHYRDHHCFFIGGCVIQQNMGNFILICFHTSLACFYSLTVIGPYLYENLRDVLEQDRSIVNVIINFCFPIAMSRFFTVGKTSYLLMITLFDALCTVWMVCSVYAGFKLFDCYTGNQLYWPHAKRKFDLLQIFGSYRLLNVFFPYNGLISSRDLRARYLLKNI